MQEKIYIKNKDGMMLCGILSNPTDDTSAPIVILCHGFPSSKEAKSMVAVESELNRQAIATFRFDFFGSGESEGNFEDVTISKWTENILSTIEYLKNVGFSKIGLFGSSSGGGASIMAAAKTKELFALVLKAPAVDHHALELSERGKEEIEKWKEEGFAWVVSSKGKSKINYSFFEDTKNNIGYDVANKIIAPTLIVHGDQDKDVPLTQSERVSQIIPDCKLEIFSGADHKFSKPEDFEKMIKSISKFIISKL